MTPCHQETPPTNLASLLKNLNLEKYVHSFEAAGVKDIETFLKLNDNELKDKIGVELLGPRRKMTTAIAKLRVTRYFSGLFVIFLSVGTTPWCPQILLSTTFNIFNDFY